MDFFAQQDRARSRTFLLVVFFLLAVVFVIFAVYAAVMAALFLFNPVFFDFYNLKLFLIIAGIAIAVIGIGSLIKIKALSGGGSYVAQSLGGKLLEPSTRDPDERRVINVVEEMAIASGTPVPLVYLLENEESINAFAAGFTPNDAVIGVTRGCCRRLTREELQGVIAHEFSHVLNGDMRLNIRLMGMLGGIMAIAATGKSVFRGHTHRYRYRSAGRGGRGVAHIYIIAFFLIVVGYMGVLLGRLIQSAVSRQREYLADASAVQFTRSTGIADALKKIGGLGAGSKIKSPAADEASHMFFGKAVSSLFATHPPLIKRIRKIEPGFTGDFDTAGTGAGRAASGEESRLSPFREAGDVSGEPVAMADMVGRITPENVGRSAAILAALPESIRKETEDILGASALVCALLLDRDPEEKEKQKEILRKPASRKLLRQVEIVEKHVQGLDPALRLPIADIAIPVLRQMSPEQFEVFKEQIRLLVKADSKITLFEFCLQEVVIHSLQEAFAGGGSRVLYKRIEPLKKDALLLIAALARVGHKDSASAGKAFEAAVSILPVKRKEIEMPEKVSFDDLHTALKRFSAASYGVKKAIFDACCQSVLCDGKVELKEAELFRAVAAAVDIPVPPFIMNS
ncbi:MAG: M48 family metallopeptidase [Desulfobacteraceae bacterium]|nr:M48 family metallopeptidase [Desulfobacteraceae bacterium]